MATEVKSLNVKTPHLSISYEESGSPNGIPIILLHGFPYTPYQYNTARSLLTTTHSQHVLIPYLRGYGPTKYLSPSTLRSGQQAVLAKDLLDFMDALSIPTAILAGYDWGGRATCIVAALRPDRVAGLCICQGYAIQNVPRDASTADCGGMSVEGLRRYWYQYYFNTPQGEIGLRERRGEICRFLWETWSPDWRFSEEEWRESEKVFENEDFVETVVHSYRVRYANVEGDQDPTVVEWEKRCAEGPEVSVPTVVLRGLSDGVQPVPENGEDKGRGKFTGWYECRDLKGVGHCPPVEAPEVFVESIMKLVARAQSGTGS